MLVISDDDELTKSLLINISNKTKIYNNSEIENDNDNVGNNRRKKT